MVSVYGINLVKEFVTVHEIGHTAKKENRYCERLRLPRAFGVRNDDD
jgi:hypothetical protein